MSARRLTTTIALLTTIAGMSIGMPAALAQNARNENAAAGRETAAAEAKRDVLPIREITLYRSGVASFQRRGLVTDDSRVRLRFNVDQINDVLKSMVVLDLAGGRVDAVSYGSKDPLSRRLSSFAVDVSDQPSLDVLLSRLRGTRIAVDTADGKVTGVILGVESRQKAAGDTVITVPVVQLSTGTSIRTIDLSTANDIEILDERVKAELTRALEALAEHRADREKDVELMLEGDGQREIVVAYVQESPVWKTSYRLVLPDEAKDDTILQGWAIVENTTDEDWTDVRLSLVSGRPVSFTMDLYEPLYMKRPEVAVPTIAGVTPRLYQWAADEGGGAGQSPFAENERAEAKSRGRSPGRPAAPAAAPAESLMFDRRAAEADASVALGAALQMAQAAAATGVDVGEVFQYRLDHPVTVERQRSAMIPIISSGVEAKRVSIYTASEGQEHPMRGVRLTNSQSLQLMPGPIAVFDGDSYAGDAQIAHMSAGETRLLAYSVDLDVEHRQEGGQTQTVQKVRIVDGMVEMRLQRENRIKHTFNNKDKSRGRTIIVEQPRLGGWDLVEPAKPLEVNDQLYRFEVEVASGKENAVEILQRVTDFSRVGVLDMNIDTLLAYARQGKASDAVVEAVRKAAGMQQTVRDIEREIQRLESERSEISRDQDRIRQNMQTIDRNSDLYRRYMTKLTEQETRVEQIATSIKQKQEELNEARRKLSEYIAGLKVE